MGVKVGSKTGDEGLKKDFRSILVQCKTGFRKLLRVKDNSTKVETETLGSGGPGTHGEGRVEE